MNGNEFEETPEACQARRPQAAPAATVAGAPTDPQPGTLKERISGLTPRQRAELASRLGRKNPAFTSASAGEPAGRIPRAHPLRVEADPSVTVYPASRGQQRMWFLQQLTQNLPAYNVPSAFHLIGAVKINRLEAALEAVIRRHEMLRTAYALDDAGLTQRVAAPSAFELRQIDLETIPAAERMSEAVRWTNAEASRPFNLADGPPFRVVLVRLGPDEHVLLVVMHHIMSDGWSRSNFYRDLAAAYGALGAGRPAFEQELPVQFTDYSAWQEGWLNAGALATQTTYWTEKLAGVSGPLELPSDRTRPALESFRGDQCSLRLEPRLLTELKARAQEEGATLFMILLAAFKTLLHRYTGQEDLIVGVPIANRPRVEVEGLIGFFANTLVMRTACPAGLTFRELLRRVKETAVDAYVHQDMPFERLVELLHPKRDSSRSALFQTSFAMRDFPAVECNLPGIQSAPWSVTTYTSKFDLSLTLERSGGEWTAVAEYSTDLFDAWRVKQLLEHWHVILEGLVANPDQRVSEMPLLTSAERQKVLVEWNRTERDYPTDKCVHQLFEDQARRTPDAVAVVDEAHQLTYAELNERANRLAHHLISLGVGPEVLVGLCVGRSLEMIVGVLGILKAGAAYVPMDPGYPRERLGMIIKDTGLGILLADRFFDLQFPDVSLQRVRVDELAEGMPSSNPDNPACPENLCYLIYTSGSTGVPKGVCIEHRNTVSFLHWVREAFTDEELSGVLFGTSICFDLSVFELFGPISWGGRVLLVENALALAGYRHRSEVKLVNTVPSVMQSLLDSHSVPASVITVNLAGELLHPALVDTICELHHVQRVNDLYGPSETTTYSTWAVRGSHQPATVGRPIANTQVYLLDSDFNPVPPGIKGELWIGGAGVARGYWRRPELTAERFLPDTFSRKPGANLYRTGDLARFRTDGSIELVGRLDHQIKLRGFRIELGEIEAALLRQPGVSQAAVVVRPGDRPHLVGFVAGSGGSVPSGDLLRIGLAAEFPDWMVPARFETLPFLPLTSNGKLDRKTLVEASRADVAAVPPAAEPATEMEVRLAQLWGDLLGVTRVSTTDKFFRLGGHSLVAMQVVARVQRQLGRSIPISAILANPTLAEFAAAVAAADPLPEDSSNRPTDRKERDPLSGEQLRQLFLWHALPDRTVYNVPFAWRLAGSLPRKRMLAAWAMLVDRHDQLRTYFVEPDGEPCQAYLSSADAIGTGWRTVDLTGLPIAERERELKSQLDGEALRSFDLSAGPLWRVVWFQLQENEAALLVTFHHAIVDDWSVRSLCQELSAVLAGGTLPEPPALRCADYARWQQALAQTAEHAAAAGFWREELSGVAGVLELPSDFPRPAIPTHAGIRCVRSCPAAVRTALLAIARETGATGFAVGLAAFQIFLARLTRQRDFIVGTPLSQRGLAGSEGVVGMLLNTIPLRARIEPEASFWGFLRKTQAALNRGLSHGSFPFDQIVQLVRNGHPAAPDLAQVLFVQVEEERPRFHLEGVSVEPLDLGSTGAKVDLTAFLTPDRDGSWQVCLVFSRDLFTHATAERLTDGFVELLGRLAAKPDAPITIVPASDQDGNQRPPADLNTPDLASLPVDAAGPEASMQTPSPYPRDANLTALFEAVVERHAEREALVAEGRRWNYRELNDAADRMAHALRLSGVGRGSRVGLHLPRSPEFVIALLGVLKAGAAYVPLATDLPGTRLQFLIEDTDPQVIVTMEEGEPIASATNPVWLRFEAALERFPDGTRPIPGSSCGPLDPAYVMFTSGSTGEPKGVVVPHRAIIRLVMGQDYLPFGPEQRFLLLAPTAFDASTIEIWGPLLHGGTCVVFPGEHPEPDLLGSVLRDEHITSLWLTAGLFNQLIDLKPETLRPVRHLLTGGEALSMPHVRRALAALPDTVLMNGYGPTENTTFTTIWTLPRDGSLDRLSSVPIGRALANTTCVVLDERQRPVGVGETGELCVGGDGLALGYFNRPELTAAKFIDAPAGQPPGARLYRTGDRVRWRTDGTLEFLGRLDNQIKIRGFRIEPGEIEAVLLQHPGVAEVAVVARADAAHSLQLVAVVVPANGAAMTVEDLRSHLGERVPNPMIPTRFELRSTLPLTINGKIDRQTLAEEIGTEITPARAESAPSTEMELCLAKIWSEILGVERIRREDSFFELGGHSLLAMRLAARLQKSLGRPVRISELLNSPVFADQARILEPVPGEGPGQRGADAPTGTAQAPVSPARETPVSTGQPCKLEQHSPGEGLGDGSPSNHWTMPLAQTGEPGAGNAVSFGDQGAPTGQAVSPAQRGLLFLHRLEPGDTSYHLPLILRLDGSLDRQALERAFRAMADRQAALRSRFADNHGTPELSFLSAEEIPFSIEDLPATTGDDGAGDWWTAPVDDFASQPFELGAGPVCRARLFCRPGAPAVLAVVMHHVVADGWSLEILTRELAEFYDAEVEQRSPRLPPINWHYADHAREQDARLVRGELAPAIRWWQQALDSLPGPLELPLCRPRVNPSDPTADMCSEWVPSTLYARVVELSRAEGNTPFVTLLTAFEVLLSRWSGQTDFVIGVPSSGRTTEHCERLVGFFMNSLPVRADLRGEPTVRGQLARTRAALLGAMDHQDVPFDRIVEAVNPPRIPGRSPLFQVFFNFQSYARNEVKPRGLRAERLGLRPKSSKFDLTIYCHEEDGGLRLNLVYRQQIFSPPKMAELLRQMVGLLEQMAADPDRSFANCSLITPASRTILPDPAMRLPAILPGSVNRRVDELARLTPEHEAIGGADAALTYRELFSRRGRLACSLRAHGIGNGSLVAIRAGRHPALVVAMLGVCQAGAAFVLLDPAYPGATICRRLELVRPDAWIELANSAARPEEISAWLDAHPQIPRISVGPNEGADPDEASASFPEPAGEARAYLAFTSGSSGEPKAIVGTHGPVAHFLEWMTLEFGIGAADRVSALSGLGHDPLLRDVLLPLWAGGTVCIPPQELIRSGRLCGWLHDQAVTVMHLTPSLADLMLSESAGPLPALRVVAFGGEGLSVSLVERFRALAPAATIVSFYGATETPQGIACTVIPPGTSPKPHVDGSGRITLGRGIEGVQLILLNGTGQQAGIGELAEIGVRSPHLAQGYLDDPEGTARKFIINPATSDPRDRLYLTGDLGRYRPDGTVEFVRRSDQQLKIRGFRIEGASIEQSLVAQPAVVAAVVVALPSSDGQPELVAGLVLEEKATLDAQALRKALVLLLPEHEIPSAFIALDRLSLTANGKLDFPEITRDLQFRLDRLGTVPQPDVSSHPIECALAGIWREILGIEHIRRHDNFFDLGGHSMSALRLIAAVRARFDRTLPLASLFLRPKFAQMAAEIADGSAPDESRPDSAFKGSGTGTPFFLIPGFFGFEFMTPSLAAAIGRSWPYFDGLQYPGLDGSEPPSTSLPEIAGHLVQQIEALCPAGPIALGGHSFGGVTAYEVARQLSARGRQVLQVILWDSFLRRGYRRRSPLEAIHVVWDRARRMPSGEGRKYLAKLVWQKSLQLRRNLARSAGLPQLEPEDPRPRLIRTVQEACAVARARYQPESYSGRVTLIQATELVPNNSIRWAPPADNGWGGLLLGPTRKVQIACMHHETFREPIHPEVVAETVWALSQFEP